MTLAISLTVTMGLRSLAFKNHRDLTSCDGYGVISGAILAEIYAVCATMSWAIHPWFGVRLTSPP
jgi:hypothetical protein